MAEMVGGLEPFVRNTGRMICSSIPEYVSFCCQAGMVPAGDEAAVGKGAPRRLKVLLGGGREMQRGGT